MANPFRRIRFHSADRLPFESAPAAARAVVLESATAVVLESAIALPPQQAAFPNDEAAARHFLGEALAASAPPPIHGFEALIVPPPGSDIRLRSVQDQALTNTRLLKFDQTHASVPVFGGQATVELRADRSLVSVDADLATVRLASALPTLSQDDAMVRIAKFAKTDPAELKKGVTPATLTLFHREADNTWHLAFLFRKVPVAPGADADAGGHGLAPRPGRREYDYLVDAHSGDILYYYSANPTALASVTLLDVLARSREVFIEPLTPGFALHDSLRKLKTFDLGGQDYWTTFPNGPVVVDAQPPTFSVAAISAHANAAHVHDFYSSVLARAGVDDRGSYVISVINVTDSSRQAPPEWHNAVWYDNKMWYGQDRGTDGALRSYSRFLDVIAHELTHGVTQNTADLVYKDQSGALNESFSDIFGVLINNWRPDGGFTALAEFDWRIGPGLGKDGTSLRDLSNPAATNQPAHMKDYLKTDADEGGVHTNSNIHNKAAYNVLTSTDAAGKTLFTPKEGAVLYYLTLSRLPRTADFARTRETLLDVAKTYYAAQSDAVRAQKLKALGDAYTAVGIESALVA